MAVLGWAGLLTVRVLEVRHDLLAAKSSAATLQQDLRRADVSASLAEVSQLQEHTDAATRDSGGLTWSVTGHVPLLGTQLTDLRTLTNSISRLADRGLVPASRALEQLQKQPPVVDGAVNPAALASLEQVLGNARVQLSLAQADVLRASRSAILLSPLRNADSQLARQITQLNGQLLPLQRSLTLAPDLLGFNGPRTYLLAVQNPAEARGTGGLIAAYSIVTADHGRLTVVRSGTNLDFPRPITPGQTYTDLMAGGSSATAASATFFAANALPDWSRAGQSLATLSAARFHLPIDGVLGLTPQAMARILTVTGPVSTAGGQRISGQNVAYFVEIGEYLEISSTAVRKAAVGDLAHVMVTKLVHGNLGLQQLRRALAGSLGTGDITFFSTHPSVEAQIRQTSISGTLPGTPAYVQVVSDNTGGGKMDAYLRRRITVTRVPDTADLTVTASFTNTAKPSELSAYQTDRLDRGGSSAPRASSRNLISLYAGKAATVGAVTLDGKVVRPLRETDLGHPRVSLDLGVDPGQTSTITWMVSGAPGVIDYVVQPLAVHEQTTIRN